MQGASLTFRGKYGNWEIKAQIEHPDISERHVVMCMECVQIVESDGTSRKRMATGCRIFDTCFGLYKLLLFAVRFRSIACLV